MSSNAFSQSLDDATVVWSLVEKQLDLFCQAWDGAHQPPPLGDYVGDYDATVRRLVLIDLVKVDIEFRVQRPDWIQPIEDYLEAYPELVTAGVVPPELLYEEIYHRRQNGLAVDLSDYERRFPQSAAAVRRLLGDDAQSLTPTSLSSNGRQIRDFQVGDVVDDFELRVQLGRGAFGVVFLALQKSMQRLVALKISPNRGTEAQVLAQLEHPNIVRVYDRRVLNEHDLQLFYMQYVRGGTLQEALQYVQSQDCSKWCGQLLLDAIDEQLREHGEVIPVPTPARLALAQSDWVKTICDLGIQIASALDYSHQKHTLHRDIKPANILLTVDGGAKLADFNISCNSKVAGASPAAYFGGSLAYMSPEQLEAYNPLHEREPQSLDGRSDFYSAAVVIWEALTGDRPFVDECFRESWEETLREMTARRRRGLGDPQWQRLPADCPSSLRAFFEQALAPEPADRFKDAAGMIRLLRIAGSQGPDANSWQTLLSAFALRHPIVVLVVASVIPNALAAVFVYFFNDIQALEGGGRSLWVAQGLINGIFFPLGAFLVLRFAWPMTQAFRARRRGEAVSNATQVIARNRSLHLGRLVFLIGMSFWAIASVVYPWVLWQDLDNTGLRDFFLSHILGGLLAGTYPFFLLTYVGLLAWYPVFLETGIDDDGTEATLLAGTQKTSSVVEALVAALPMLYVVLLVFGTGSHQRLLAAFSVSSLVGASFLYWLSRGIRARIEKLASILTPQDAISRRG